MSKKTTTFRKSKGVKLYAVETTDKMRLCKINARNVELFHSIIQAESRAVIVALSNQYYGRGRVRESTNIRFDEILDGVRKVYDKTDGNAKDASALAFITECVVTKTK